MNTLIRVFEVIVKGGPWALVVLIMLAWLAADYGYIRSVPRSNAEAIRALQMTTDKAQTKSQQTLERIADILEEQRTIQARTGLLACIKEAKSDIDRTECIKRYPIQGNERRNR
jgi:hypothetical protein